MLMQLLGGVGLFLLGMILLTDGLKAFAGDALRKALLRFTGRPVTAFCSGAVVTALVQSSSATTLATIGFVSAGLIGFAQSIGIVFGASLGTTSTGWIVSTLGLKFSVGLLALPLICIGAFMRLLGPPRLASLGLALAGFGLIFVGIDALQAGMSGLAEAVDLSRMPARGFWGHLALLAVGVAMTVVMQSSSAAVATTLAALHAGAIDFEQAASLVIGQAIGTTVTAAIAAIGATTAAKRTALAHILFNAATGLIALVLLPVFLALVTRLTAAFEGTPGAVSLAAFHTLFIGFGVVLFLPFTSQFARLIERILPEKGFSSTRYLDRSLLQIPPVALAAASRSLGLIAGETLSLVEARAGFRPVVGPVNARRERLKQGLNEVRVFISSIPAGDGAAQEGVLRSEVLHALDHLTQMLELEPPGGWSGPTLLGHAQLAAARTLAETAFGAAQELMAAKEAHQLCQAQITSLAEAANLLAEGRRAGRKHILEAAAAGRIDATDSLRVLDELRWIDSTVYQLWRCLTHLSTSHGSDVVDEGAASS